MIKITNNRDLFEVSKGAFESIYKDQGFHIVEEVTAEKAAVTSFDDVEEVEEEPNDFVLTLLEKPLTQWNKEEVRQFCEIKEINIAGTKNPAEAKAKIKAFLENEEKQTV